MAARETERKLLRAPIRQVQHHIVMLSEELQAVAGEVAVRVVEHNLRRYRFYAPRQCAHISDILGIQRSVERQKFVVLIFRRSLNDIV